jgi:glycosyltransferase 2 family protein
MERVTVSEAETSVAPTSDIDEPVDEGAPSIEEEAIEGVIDGAKALAKKPTWRSRLINGVRILVALAIVFYLINTTVKQWDKVKETFHQLSWATLIGAFLLVLIGLFGNLMAWRAALTDLEHRIPVRTAAPIMLIGQLGKYLPGSVWAYVVQMDLGRRAGVPRTKAFIASLVSTGLGVAVGLLLGTIGLPTAFQAAKDDAHGSVGRIAFYVALVLLPIAIICSIPRVLTKLLGLMLKLLRRPPLDRPLSWRGSVYPGAWSAFTYVCVGLQLYLLAHGTAGHGVNGLLRCIGFIALAMSVSVFVVIAPSGIGVREFLIVIALGGGGAALGIALASRLLFTIADVVGAGVAAAVGLRKAVPVPAAGPTPER